MVKISAALIKNHRRIKSVTYTNLNEYKSEDFYFYVTEICRRLDISTPLIVPYTVKCYDEFNSVKIPGEDFVDSVNFDALYLENSDR